MPKARKPPQRTCVGCGEIGGKRELVRVVRTPDGVVVDPTGKRNGRGAYLHRDAACFQRAIGGRLARSLGVEMGPEAKAALQEAFGAILLAPVPRKPMVHRAPVPLPPELIARDRRGAPRTQRARRAEAGPQG